MHVHYGYVKGWLLVVEVDVDDFGLVVGGNEDSAVALVDAK